MLEAPVNRDLKRFTDDVASRGNMAVSGEAASGKAQGLAACRGPGDGPQETGGLSWPLPCLCLEP